MKTRYVAIILVIFFLMPIFTGCKAKTEVTILENSAWYNHTRSEFQIEYDDELINCTSELIGECNGGIVIYSYGQVLNSSNLWTDENASHYDTNPEWLDYYSLNGEHISRIYANELPEMTLSEHIISVNISGESIKILTECFRSGNRTQTVYSYDPDQWRLVSSFELTGIDDMPNDAIMTTVDYYGEKYVITYRDNSNNVLFAICENDELIKTIDTSGILSNTSVTESKLYDYDDNSWLLEYYSANQERNFVIVNKEDNKINRIDHNVSSELISDYSSFRYDEEIGLYIAESDGLKVVDFASKTKTTIFDYNHTFANISEGLEYTIKTSFNNEDIVICGMGENPTHSQAYSSEYCFVYVLTGSDDDPRETRTEIKLACVDIPPASLYCEISEFNTNNNEYYISLDTRYQIDTLIPDYTSYNEYDYEMVAAISDICDQLAVDLLSGEGPDIVINAFEFNGLNSTEYLLDLSSYADSLSNEDYFTSIIDASYKDGVLYQLPLSFSLQAIITESSLGAYPVNMSFDDYERFYSDYCNGDDPISFSRDDYFIFLYNSMNDLFIHNNALDINNSDFITIVNYVNNNIPSSGRSIPFDVLWETTGQTNRPAYLNVNSDYSTLVWSSNSSLENIDLIGVPSVDQRGPVARITNSIAISASTDSAEGCMEFINQLIDDDYQYDISCGMGNPIKRSQMIAMIDDVVESHNLYIQYLMDNNTVQELESMGIDSYLIENIDYESYLQIIDSCNHVYTSDPSISNILREEMPAYFEGQKSLNDVIIIIEDRVNTYLSERR